MFSPQKGMAIGISGVFQAKKKKLLSAFHGDIIPSLPKEIWDLQLLTITKGTEKSQHTIIDLLSIPVQESRFCNPGCVHILYKVFSTSIWDQHTWYSLKSWYTHACLIIWSSQALISVGGSIVLFTPTTKSCIFAYLLLILQIQKKEQGLHCGISS